MSWYRHTDGSYLTSTHCGAQLVIYRLRPLDEGVEVWADHRRLDVVADLDAARQRAHDHWSQR